MVKGGEPDTILTDFVTIATILGTGILGLPVTLTKAGLYPFLVSFIIGYVMQALLILHFTELLQKAYAIQLKTNKDETIPLTDLLDDDKSDDQDQDHEHHDSVLADHVIIPKDATVKPPNLHLLGELFLSCGMRQLFDIAVVLQFMAALISYALAGSEAYAELIGIDFYYVIPVFVWVLTFAIVFALGFIQPAVSILTLFKGSLLLVTVVITFGVGSEIHKTISNDFRYIGAPFLMGTVALGGTVNLMPFLYEKISPVKEQVINYRRAIFLGLTTCTILNILWCWAILDIVPQTVADATCSNQSLASATDARVASTVLDEDNVYVCENSSLESANINGEISTIPLTKIILSQYPAYSWLAMMVEIFIVVSITVSYLTFGAALHHTSSSIHIAPWLEIYEYPVKSNYFYWSGPTVYVVVTSVVYLLVVTAEPALLDDMCASVLSLLVFAVVFAVAMLNPKSFIILLERFSSFVMNIEAGLFIFIMLLRSRNTENRHLEIALPLPPYVFHLLYVFPVYFGFAVLYDVANSIFDVVNLRLSSTMQHGFINGSSNLTLDNNFTMNSSLISL